MPPTERYIVATVEDHENKFMLHNTEFAAMAQARAWAQDDLSEPVYIAKIVAAYNFEAPLDPTFTRFPE